jgi:hypothetical protein
MSLDREWNHKLKTRDTSLVSLIIVSLICTGYQHEATFILMSIQNAGDESQPRSDVAKVSVKMKDGAGSIEAEVVHSREERIVRILRILIAPN